MNYIFNSSISGIEDADLILLVGTNPRHEASILNARIRKTFVHKKIPIFSIGNPGDLTYEYKIIGDSTEDIKKIVNKEHDFSQKLLSAKKPIIIIGESALELNSGGYIFEEFKKFLTKNNLINESWNGLNILVQNASTVGLLDLKILKNKKEKASSFFDDLKNRKFKLLYLLGSDNLEFQKNDEFIVYQGSHGDRGAEVADIILPSATYTEQNGLYENLEGRIQECKKASYPIGEALEDWKIFNRIVKKLGFKDKTPNFDELRKEVLETVPNFSDINELPKNLQIKTHNIETSFLSEKILIRELDYYYTNSISRSSKTMSECRQIRQKIKKDGTNN
jgi:NADH-quinone oxidoreductase subunit G